MSITTIATRHAEVIDGLANAQDFLAAHPDLPLGTCGNPLRVSIIGGSDEENRAEIDRIAGILGVTAEGDTHYTAVLHFGGGVTYEATAISRREMDSYETYMAQWYARDAA